MLYQIVIFNATEVWKKKKLNLIKVRIWVEFEFSGFYNDHKKLKRKKQRSQPFNSIYLIKFYF